MQPLMGIYERESNRYASLLATINPDTIDSKVLPAIDAEITAANKEARKKDLKLLAWCVLGIALVAIGIVFSNPFAIAAGALIFAISLSCRGMKQYEYGLERDQVVRDFQGLKNQLTKWNEKRDTAFSFYKNHRIHQFFVHNQSHFQDDAD